MSWLSIAAPIVGGLLGAQSSKKGTSTTSENKLDPRMDRYVYGADGQSGLMGSAFDLAQQQLKTGGLNDMQRQGMDMQRQYLMSPQYQQGFSGMMGLGQSLMGGGVAGNPFNKSGGVAGNPFAGSPFSYSGEQNATLPSYTSQPSLTAPPAPAPTTGLLGGGGHRQVGGQGGGATGGGGGSSSGGQGISSAGISAALAAMAASENPAIRAISPTVAAILGIGGRLGADHQIDAISDSFGEMGAIDGMGLGGVGSISDADGNIRSITTPGLVAAYDTATFGGGSGGGPNGPGGVNSDGNSYGGSWGASYGESFNGGGGGGGGGGNGGFGNGGGFGGSGGFGRDGKGFGGNGSLGD